MAIFDPAALFLLNDRRPSVEITTNYCVVHGTSVLYIMLFIIIYIMLYILCYIYIYIYILALYYTVSVRDSYL